MHTILILANSSGGLYDFRNELLVELLKHNKVIVSVPDNVKVKELEEEGCEIIFTPINRRGVNPKEDFKLFFTYQKILKQYKPDLTITYTIKPNIYGGYACRRLRIPYIATITGIGGAFQKRGILKRLIIFMYRRGLRKAECVFFQNKQNQDLFEKLAITGKRSILVSGSGVNLTRHTYEQYPQEDITRFLFIGRIMKEKGIEEFLEAAEELHDANTVFEVLGYCDEDYQAKLDECEEKGIVRQLGFQTEVHEFLKAASAVVLPTYHEGMSNVLMEASATGRPVIASNISGCREIFDERISGFGFEPRSSESLIAAVKKFLALSLEERAAMGHNARTKMELEFDRSKVTHTYIKEIDEILQCKS